MAGVRRTQDYIAAGDVYQLVLASRFSGRHELDPFQAYRALRLINPSPYMYYCALGEVAVVGSSPEALVKLNGRRAQLRPIAGTRPRSPEAAIDRAREAQLLADPKENAEHVMLVDRDLYGGTVGYFGARGDMDHAITIRTLVFSGDEYSYQAGAGIVADSVPEAEHEEVLAKSAALVRALELAGEGL